MKKAIVALARRLAVIMHRIWVDGELCRNLGDEVIRRRGLTTLQ